MQEWLYEFPALSIARFELVKLPLIPSRALLKRRQLIFSPLRILLLLLHVVLLKDEVVLLRSTHFPLIIPLLVLIGKFLHSIEQCLLALTGRFEAISDARI